MNLYKSVIVAVAALTAMPVMAQKSIPLVYDQEFTGAKYPAPAFPAVDDAKSLETLKLQSIDTQQVSNFTNFQGTKIRSPAPKRDRALSNIYKIFRKG